ncbi:hypothetical protein ABPG72_018001 [Tetrahymena utriculariae]
MSENLIECTFREFLYYLQVSEDFFNFLEQLEIQENIQIIVKQLREEDQIVNISQWKDIGNNKLKNKEHFHTTYNKFKNHCKFIQQTYLKKQQYLIEDTQLTQDLLSIISLYGAKYNIQTKEAYIRVKSQINCFLQEKIDEEVSITNIDLDIGIIYIDINSKHKEYVLKINQIIQDYVNQFEIESVKPKSLYEPFLEQLSLKYQFAYIKKRKCLEQSAIQDSKKVEKIQKENDEEFNHSKLRSAEQKNYERSQEENDSQEDEENEKIILIRKRVIRDQVEEAKAPTKEKGSIGNENNQQQIEQLSLKQIGQLIEEENCDRFKTFDKFESEILDKIIFLVNEFQFDDKIFKKYNVFIEIEDNIMNIFGDINGNNLIDQLVYQLKNYQDILIESVQMHKNEVQQVKEDIDELNAKFKNEKITQITLIGITFEVYSKLVGHEESNKNENSDDKTVKISYIDFKKPHNKDVFEYIFKLKSHFIKIEQNYLSSFQEKFISKFGKLVLKQNEQSEFLCSQRIFNKFEQSLKETKNYLSSFQEEFISKFGKLVLKQNEQSEFLCSQKIFNKFEQNLKETKNYLSSFQEEFISKFGKLVLKQNEQYEFVCSQRRFNQFKQSLKETRQGLMIKEDFGVQQILFDILFLRKKEDIIKLQSKYKFAIILEALDDSNKNQLCLICPDRKKEKIKKQILEDLNEIKKNDVTELNYEISEDDLEMFSQKGDYFMKVLLDSKEQDESDKQEEEELIEKNLKNSQIYLQYYLSDIIYEFKNNLIDIQRQRSNQINKNFKIILSQNQLNKDEDEINGYKFQRENIQEFKKEISIQMISTLSFEIETNTLLKGSASYNLIIIDHMYEKHIMRLEELYCKGDNIQAYIQMREINQQQIENKFLNLDELKENLSTITDQQVHLKIKESLFNQETQNQENSLVLVGLKLVDSIYRFVNQNELDQMRSKFFNDIFQNAFKNGNKIHIMVSDKELRSQLIQRLLYTLESCQVQYLSQDLLIKIYFIQLGEDQEILKQINTQTQQLQGKDIQKAEQEIENALQIFKNHEKSQSEQYISQAIENAQWYIEEENQGKSKQKCFDQITCQIIDDFYRDYLKQTDKKSQNQYYFIHTKDYDLAKNDYKSDREVRIDFQNSEVIIKFLNISISFNLFFKFYPQLEQIINKMSTILSAFNNDGISLHATIESAKKQTIQDLIFEGEVDKVIFYEDKYYIEPHPNPHFQNQGKKKFYINRQALISDSNACIGNETLKHEKIRIKYDYKRENANNQREKYSLKLLVEKKNQDKAKKNLQNFFEFRRSNFEKAKQKQKEMSKKENSLQFFYYTPKLNIFFKQLFKMNEYTVIEHQKSKCFYIVTSNSKTQIKNLEKNEISQLKLFQDESWYELLNEAEKKVSKKVTPLNNAAFFLNQLSSNHTQYLCSLKNWEITGFKPYFFLIYNNENKQKLENLSSLEITFSIFSRKDIFRYLYQQKLAERDTFFQNFDKQRLNLANEQQDINILVFLNVKNQPEGSNLIPLFYLLFQK